jgi:hypothetical protein
MWETLLLSTEPNGTFCQADDCQVVMTGVYMAWVPDWHLASIKSVLLSPVHLLAGGSPQPLCF